MKIRFIHPETGIPMVGRWEDRSAFFFDIESPDEIEKAYSEEVIETTYNWCMRNSFNCDNVNRAYTELAMLDITDYTIL